jgi:hypothetical protein
MTANYKGGLYGDFVGFLRLFYWFGVRELLDTWGIYDF